ncbi:hypothetical protein A1O1_04148 [Capronia coronata CBS 617.96]|uniref:SAP domain-containing protein n=1 Tax=Capronia coronata CBS 617.96 TaxID=1182541 RepID=W9YP78_9EURO|nr:uncharacterized protein A1O1_04148 [Capronia coronata CBS 617.96]EXJ91041.1 hypothetical protein A1O1_04148 [Capronia coronata CBS 617.96]
MTDWSKLKVTDLKDELKARGIPLTGLKLKQQYIDKLEEHEAQNSAQPESVSDDAEDAGAEEQAPAQPNGDNRKEHDGALPSSDETEQKPQGPHDVEDDKPQELRQEDQQPQDIQPASSSAQELETKEQISADSGGQKDVPLVPESEELEKQTKETKNETDAANLNTKQDAGTDDGIEREPAAVAEPASPGQKTALQPSADPAHQPLLDSAQSSDLADEERKRRKRSATPVPSEEDVARKKARLSMDGEDVTVEQLSELEQMKSATESAKQIRGEATNGGPPAEVIVEQPGEDMTMTTESLQQAQDTTPEERKRLPESPRRSRSPSEDRDVPPAIHPATSSIYIRNFKRPLHIPSLRSHVASSAKSRSSTDNSDPITLFYLDSIRTHAFISFTSVAAASRVRSAMHDIRYPNESMREPLFVDFVPDEKVQSWIDQETGGGFGGRGGGGRRFEVVYEDRDDGVEAVLQEVDANKPQHPLAPSRSSRMSTSIDRPGPEPLPAGVHPDRAAFVPRELGQDRDRDRERERDRVRQPPTGPKNAESTGRGFKALDELFQYTTTKPKLYYKPVPESVAAERLDMFRNLRVGYANLGRSGDEGMKRYSFEQYKGREEWVDKGPEFGYGRRGQDRLVGGRPRGGFRGRGGDSWRGGMAR